MLVNNMARDMIALSDVRWGCGSHELEIVMVPFLVR
jgi:hypothetical protein